MLLQPSKCARACAECKRRKIKCEGGQPCYWCTSKGIECLIPLNGPPSPSDIFSTSLSLLSQNLMVDAELSKYCDLAYNFTPLSLVIGIDFRLIQSPLLRSHNLIKYATAAHTARAFGNTMHSTSLIADAKRFSTTLRDEMSIESVAGFIILAFFWFGSDEAIMQQYFQVASKIFNKISTKNIPPALAGAILGCRTIFDSRIKPSLAVKKYLTDSESIPVKDNAEACMLSLSRLFSKVYCNNVAALLGFNRADAVAVMLAHVSFTERQRDDLFYEVEVVRKLVGNPPPTNLYLPFIALEVLTILVNWRSGHVDIALSEAIKFAEKASLELLMFGGKFEADALLMICILLYENRQFELAQKVQQIASMIFSHFRAENHQINDCVPMLSNFIQETLSSSSSPINHMPNDPAKITALVANLVQVASLFTPGNDPKQLVSPHGLHVWYKSFSSICPIPNSPYALYPLACCYFVPQEAAFDDISCLSSILFSTSSPSSQVPTPFDPFGDPYNNTGVPSFMEQTGVL